MPDDHLLLQRGETTDAATHHDTAASGIGTEISGVGERVGGRGHAEL